MKALLAFSAGSSWLRSWLGPWGMGWDAERDPGLLQLTAQGLRVRTAQSQEAEHVRMSSRRTENTGEPEGKMTTQGWRVGAARGRS